ncbi:glycoside hydrolase family 6 protein [Cryptosporangium minutisporangium]|uniref:glycoside hydrolase family 6 protein n=1 Tax=Cryptosporangium minutisporangium TaxID=113569 RepID=UPI0031EF1908
MTDAPRAGLLRRAGLRAGPYLARHRRERANGRVLTAGVGAAALGSVVVIGGTSLVAANATTDPDHSCAAAYTVRHAWSTGFSAEVAVTNTGEDPVKNWNVNWSFDGGKAVVKGWEGDWQQDEGLVTVRAGEDSVRLEPGKTLTLRFTGWHPQGKAPDAANFALNGVSCGVDEGAEETPESASPTPSSIALPPGLPASPAPTAKPTKPAAGPLGSLFVDPSGQAVEWVESNSGDPRASVIRERIAEQPQAHWLAANNPGDVESDVRGYTSRAHARGKVPVLVAYNMTNRDCGGASAGGADSADAYRNWISNFASGLGSGTSIIILEPDALGHLTTCLSEGQQEERLDLLEYAGKVIKQSSPKARVFYDIGHSAWINASEAASRAKRAGATQYGDGVALNTSNYNTSSSEVSYGKRVLAALGGGQMVVDTSRNGAGPAGGEWCDPAGRKLGRYPTTATGDPKVAAYLWVKRPGESDGCSGSAGQFIPETAYDLSS